jgi:hypothetical protein
MRGMKGRFSKFALLFKPTFLAAALLATASAQATPTLIGVGSLSSTTDLSGLSGTLENGVDPANVPRRHWLGPRLGGRQYVHRPARPRPECHALERLRR